MTSTRTIPPRSARRRLGLVALGVILLFLAACGSSGAAAPAEPGWAARQNELTRQKALAAATTTSTRPTTTSPPPTTTTTRPPPTTTTTRPPPTTTTAPTPAVSAAVLWLLAPAQRVHDLSDEVNAVAKASGDLDYDLAAGYAEVASDHFQELADGVPTDDNFGEMVELAYGECADAYHAAAIGMAARSVFQITSATADIKACNLYIDTLTGMLNN